MAKAPRRASEERTRTRVQKEESTTYGKKPTFQALKANGYEPTDEFKRDNFTGPLWRCVDVAMRSALAAGCYFRGVYPRPYSLGDDVYEDLSRLWPNPYHLENGDGAHSPDSAEADIERFANELDGYYCWRGASLDAPWNEPREFLQSLAVEVMMAVDSELLCVKAGELESALMWQAIALENLMECQGQAHVVLGPRAVVTLPEGYVPSYVRERRARRVRRPLPANF
jgi:hypothetical protein